MFRRQRLLLAIAFGSASFIVSCSAPPKPLPTTTTTAAAAAAAATATATAVPSTVPATGSVEAPTQEAPFSQPTKVPATPAGGRDFTLTQGVPMALGSGFSTIELTGYVIEEIAPSPDDAETYPGGSGVTMSVNLSGETVEFSDLSAGYSSQSVVYTSGANSLRAELLSNDPKTSTVVVRVHRVLETEEQLLNKELTIKRGETLEVEPGFELEFQAHGHKAMLRDSPPGPLIVSMRYHLRGRRAVDDSNNLYKPYRWIWQRYKFEIVSHSYNDNMVLRISRLALGPMPSVAN